MKPESWKKLWPWQRDKPQVQTIDRLEGELVVLRPKRMDDVPADYMWRIDPELADLDATRPINLTIREYGRYQKDELQFPSPWSVRLAIDTLHDDRHIGNCMYYDINRRRGVAELGIMIGDRRYWGAGYGTDAVRTLLDHIFTTTDLDSVYLHTLKWNDRARQSFAKAGFREIRAVFRNGYDFVRMEILRDEWDAAQSANDVPDRNGSHGE